MHMCARALIGQLQHCNIAIGLVFPLIASTHCSMAGPLSDHGTRINIVVVVIGSQDLRMQVALGPLNIAFLWLMQLGLLRLLLLLLLLLVLALPRLLLPRQPTSKRSEFSGSHVGNVTACS